MAKDKWILSITYDSTMKVLKYEGELKLNEKVVKYFWEHSQDAVVNTARVWKEDYLTRQSEKSQPPVVIEL